MKLTTFLLIASLVQVSAASFAQRITLSQNKATLKQIFAEIKKQTNYDVFYQTGKVKENKVIHANFSNTPLEKVIEQCLEGEALTFTIEEKTVLIKQKEPSLLDRVIDNASTIISNALVTQKTLVIQSAAKDVRGRVLDQDGKPLPNASIRIKGKNTVTNTNADGEFEIKGVEDDAVLLVSYVGFKTLEIALKDAVMPLEIKLNVATGELEEVKVVYNTGYQELNKERSTGSFVQIDNETINRGVSPNILDRISYLTSSLRKGLGGNATTDITIRGLSTINKNAKPLIVIDGFPYDEQGLSTNSTAIQLNNLNPNDIETITILRDAAAASIWGARSANGVIVISTKKGKLNQKTSINFRTNTTLTERPDLFKLSLMSPKDAIDYERKLFASGFYDTYNGPFAANYSYPQVSSATEILLARKRNAISQQQADEQLTELAEHDTRNDINKYLLRTAITQQYAFNVSGGAEKMTYYNSVGYNKSTDSEVGNGSNTLTIVLNNTYRPVKNLELNSYLNYAQIKTKTNAINYRQFIANGNNFFAPYTMLADINGNHMSVPLGGLREAYKDTVKTLGLLDWHYRPLDELNNQDNTAKSFNLRFGGGIKYTILRGLNIDIKGQYNRTTSNIEIYKSLRHYDTRNLINQFMSVNTIGQPQYPIPYGGILDLSNRVEVAYDLRGSLNFDKTWGMHSVSAISGIDVRESQNDYIQFRRYGYDPLTLSYANNISYGTSYTRRPSGNSIIPENGNIDGLLIRNYSYYGNVGYSLLNKYSLNASGRVDATNLFGMKANLKAKPNWSVGTSWNISREDFFNIKSISSLTFRGTFGYNGNVDNNSTSLPVISYNTNSQTYQLPQQYASLSSPPNPGISWEKVRQINLALDFGLFNNRLSGSLEYYAKKASNLITLGAPTDQTSGVNSYTGNFGGLKAEGVDLILNGLIVDHGVKLRTGLNVSYNTDELSDYYNAVSLLSNPANYVSGQVRAVGKPLNSLYSYRWAGLDNQSGSPMGIINDQVVPFTTVFGSTGGVRNTQISDLVYHGHGIPIVTGNILNDISYKGIVASFNITYAFGYYFRKASVDFNTIQSRWSSHGDYGLRWQKPGDELTTNVPAMPLISDSRYSFYSLSEVLVEKGDHIRLRDIRLSYNLTKTSVKRLPFNAISFSVMADNLNVLFWRANKAGIDPDFNNTVPNPRSITFGLNLNY